MQPKKLSGIKKEKIEKYFLITGEALALAEKNVSVGRESDADLILDTAKRYFSDARHFEIKGDIVNAFAALNYAHGWLDCGARLGIFDVHNSKLFAVDD